MDIVEKRIRISGVDPLSLLGINDSNLQIISDRFDANIIVRGDNITIKGEEDETARVEKVFKELIYVLDKTGVLRPDDVVTVVELVSGEGEAAVASETGTSTQGDNRDVVVLSARNDLIKPKTPGQRQFVRAVWSKPVEENIIESVAFPRTVIVGRDDLFTQIEMAEELVQLQSIAFRRVTLHIFAFVHYQHSIPRESIKGIEHNYSCR